MREYDVAIAGAGPAGLALASLLASGGLNVLVLEEDQEIGYPVKCAGIVSRRSLGSLLPACPRPPEFTPLASGKVAVAGLGSLEVDVAGLGVVAIDRRAFDVCLFHRAADDGAEVRLAERVTSASRQGGSWVIRSRAGEYRARALVDARGAPAYPRRKGLLHAVQYTCAARSGPGQGAVEVLVDKGASREHFFWMVGLEGREVLVGGAGSSPASVEAEASRLASAIGCAPLRVVRSPIVVGGFVDRPSMGDFGLGDAAGQSKPTTGGGDMTSLQAAGMLAPALSGYLSGELTLEEARSAYRSSWSRARGREESLERLARAVYERLDNGSVWRLLVDLKGSGALDRLASADFDSLGAWALASLGAKVLRGLALAWASELLRGEAD